MARPKSKSREALISSAMRVFWRQGYTATSIEDLVRATGVGRGGIYTDFGGKEALFLKCLENYRQTLVEPALDKLTADTCGLSSIEAFFDHFIALHAAHGMPGPGCFVGNTMTELAPHDTDVRAIVNSHMSQLKSAFLTALVHETQGRKPKRTKTELQAIASFLTTTSQGMWSAGRTMGTLEELENIKTVVFDLVRARLSADTCAPAAVAKS